MQCTSALRDEVPKWLGHDWHGELKIKIPERRWKLVTCIAGFCVSEAHELNDSLLFYMGECLVYAGAIFNVRLFILREIRKHFDKSKES